MCPEPPSVVFSGETVTSVPAASSSARGSHIAVTFVRIAITTCAFAVIEAKSIACVRVVSRRALRAVGQSCRRSLEGQHSGRR